MTFDNGVLELMSPRRQHENIGRLLGRIVETFTEVSGIEIQSVASTTFRRPDLQRAFEADESYYIQHAEQIRPKEEVDLTVDPPPDLVIEVELTSSAISKLQLFAAMGIPEVWRHNGESLTMFRLADDNYVRISESEQITGLTTAMADSLLSKRFEMGENALIRTFRASIETV
jgi:Uma2 family endonuclease